MSAWFTDDTRAEGFFKTIGVKFRYVADMSRDKLADNWNDRNMGRPTNRQRIEDAVLNYAAQAEAGSPMPAVVIWKNPGQKFEVLDGCQRLTGAFEVLDATHFAAYVLNCDYQMAGVIRRVINLRLNGCAPVDEEFSIQAMVEEFEAVYSAKEMAQFLGVGIAKVNRYLTRHRGLRMMTDAAHKVGESLPNLNKFAMDYIIRYSDPTDWEKAPKECLQFCQQLSKGNFNNGDSKEFVQKQFDIRRIASKRRATQLRSKNNELLADELFIGKLQGKKTIKSVDKLLRAAKSFETIAKQSKKAGVVLDDTAAVQQIEDHLKNAGRILRELCTNKVRNHADPFPVS